jgi:Papain-like cysteine protease AvrRpt2
MGQVHRDENHHGRVVFEKVPESYPNSPIGVSLEVSGNNLNPLNYNLNQGNPSIAAVQSEDHFHWVLITGIDSNGNYTILDPGHKNETILEPSKIKKYREIITK